MTSCRGGVTMADTVLESVIARARALVAAVTFDDSGAMVGGQWVGGHGGLLSRETLRATDRLRLALDAHDRSVVARQIEGRDG